MDLQQASKRLRFSIEYILSPDIDRNTKKDTAAKEDVTVTDKMSSSPDTSSSSDKSPGMDSLIKARRGKSRVRTTFTTSQIQQLETKFMTIQYPDPQQRNDIATSLGLSEKKVKTWFQNRRMKLKRDYWNGVKQRRHNVSQTQFPPTIAVPINRTELSTTCTVPVNQTDLSTTIAVPCTLPCLVSSKPSYQNYQIGAEYIQRMPYVGDSLRFHQSRQSDTYQNMTTVHQVSQHRLSHFDVRTTNKPQCGQHYREEYNTVTKRTDHDSRHSNSQHTISNSRHVPNPSAKGFEDPSTFDVRKHYMRNNFVEKNNNICNSYGGELNLSRKRQSPDCVEMDQNKVSVSSSRYSVESLMKKTDGSCKLRPIVIR